MNDAQRNILTAGLVCAASASLISGIYYRARIDDAAMGLRSNDLLAPGLSASRDPKVTVSETEGFVEITKRLQQHYVDPIENEDKLAIGAVKGMISSLDDERSLYLGQPVFRSLMRSLQGEYEGIGASVSLVREGAPSKGARPRTAIDFLSRVPRVQLAYVVPNGPADKAGLKAGDEIESIDGRWVVNPLIGPRFRKVDADVRAGKLPAKARTEMQAELRQKFGNSMMPLRALERLTVGTEGNLEIEIRRGAEVRKASVIRSRSTVAVNKIAENGILRLSFVAGAPEALKAARSKDGAITLDLRGSSQGDLKSMAACLGVVGGSGDCGSIVRAKGQPQLVRATDPGPAGKPIRVLVDRYTKGVAEAFALALKAKGLGHLEGGPTGGDPAIIERTSLPDGSGFTLRVGDYRAPGGSK